jgi:hypothetical protein
MSSGLCQMEQPQPMGLPPGIVIRETNDMYYPSSYDSNEFFGGMMPMSRQQNSASNMPGFVFSHIPIRPMGPERPPHMYYTQSYSRAQPRHETFFAVRPNPQNMRQDNPPNPSNPQINPQQQHGNLNENFPPNPFQLLSEIFQGYTLSCL